jgi:hypothetical protein
MALFINDTDFPESVDNIEIFKRVGKRQITHVFHDIDGTHSLIRNWQPVMSLLLSYVIENGLEKDYDEDDNIQKLAKTVGDKSQEETDRFCIESAGAAVSAFCATVAPFGRSEETSSPGVPTAHTAIRHGTSSPSPKNISRSVPDAVDEHSKLALSVS